MVVIYIDKSDQLLTLEILFFIHFGVLHQVLYSEMVAYVEIHEEWLIMSLSQNQLFQLVQICFEGCLNTQLLGIPWVVKAIALVIVDCYSDNIPFVMVVVFNINFKLIIRHAFNHQVIHYCVGNLLLIRYMGGAIIEFSVKLDVVLTLFLW